VAAPDWVDQNVSDPKPEDNLIAYNELVRRHFASIYFIKEYIGAEAWDEVAEFESEIPTEDREALWKAPSKGGIWTTAERAALKSNEMNASRKLFAGDEK